MKTAFAPPFFAVTVLVACGAMLDCGSFREAREDANRTQAAIKTELGLDASVSFRKYAASNSQATLTVIVRLKNPPGDAQAAKRQVSEVVARTFRSRVARVDLVF